MNLETVSKVEKLIRNLIDKMGFSDSDIEIKADRFPKIYVNINAFEDNALLVGHKGDTIKALQFIVNIMIKKTINKECGIMLNIGDYRERHQKQIKQMAIDAANDVKAKGQGVKLPPLNSYERRIVHKVIDSSFNTLTSRSMGEGRSRSIIIEPKSDNEE